MIRKGDDPKIKESIIAELYGKFIGYLEEQGLTKGKEFEGTIKDDFTCSQRYIHIWDTDKTKEKQIVVYFNATQLMIEFGICKKPKDVIYKNKLENLRYNISDFTQPELIETHQKKFKEFFEDFKNKLKTN